MSEGKGGGYGNPPKHSQFKPGQSGNPNGRPKGSKNKKPGSRLSRRLNELVLSEAERPVSAIENGERIKIPTAQAILRQMAKKAFEGSTVAQREFLKMTKEAEKEQSHDLESMIETVSSYREATWNAIAQAKQMGREPPEPIPHPDNIEICFLTGQVTITGLCSIDDKKTLEKWHAEVAAFDNELLALTDELELAEGGDDAAYVMRDIAQAEEARAFYNKVIDGLLKRKIVLGAYSDKS